MSFSARWMTLALFAATLLWADQAGAKSRWVLATGRRDPRIYAIDLEQALKPANDNTPNAIVSRSLVHPRRLDGTRLGDPANLVLSEDEKTAYVMNHHGGVVNAEFTQHGGRASIAVMDVRKMLRRELDDTDAIPKGSHSPTAATARRISSRGTRERRTCRSWISARPSLGSE